MSDGIEKFKIKFTLTCSTGFQNELRASISTEELEAEHKCSFQHYQKTEEIIREYTFSAQEIEGLDLATLSDEFEYNGEGTLEVEHQSNHSYYDGDNYDCNMTLTVDSFTKGKPIDDDWMPTDDLGRTFKTVNEENDFETLKLRVLSPSSLFVCLHHSFSRTRQIVKPKDFIQAVCWFLNSNEADRAQLLLKAKLKI